ncbi:MAG: outer membrane beta-barrel protein [candidate division WOR-3 bacterium]
MKFYLINLIKAAAMLPLLLVLVHSSNAQDSIGNMNITHQNQVRFWLSPLLFNQLLLEHQGEILLKSNPALSFELGIGFSQRITNHVCLNAGAGWGIIPFKFEYNFNAKMTNNLVETNQHDLKSYEFYINHCVFPLSIQYEFIKHKNYYYNFEAGVKLNSILSYPYETTVGASYYINQNNPDIKLFEIHLENYYQKNFISYFAKFGLTKQTKKSNTLNGNIIINYCPQKIGKGYYRFYNLPFESYGQTSLGINFIGMEFSYGLTLTKRYRREK